MTQLNNATGGTTVTLETAYETSRSQRVLDICMGLPAAGRVLFSRSLYNFLYCLLVFHSVLFCSVLDPLRANTFRHPINR